MNTIRSAWKIANSVENKKIDEEGLKKTIKESVDKLFDEVNKPGLNNEEKKEKIIKWVSHFIKYDCYNIKVSETAKRVLIGIVCTVILGPIGYFSLKESSTHLSTSIYNALFVRDQFDHTKSATIVKENRDYTESYAETKKENNYIFIFKDGRFSNKSLENIKMLSSTNPCGILYKPSDCTKGSLFKDLDAIKTNILLYNMSLPVFFDIDVLYDEAKASEYNRANIILAELFYNELKQNGINVVLCGTDEHLAKMESQWKQYAGNNNYQSMTKCAKFDSEDRTISCTNDFDYLMNSYYSIYAKNGFAKNVINISTEDRITYTAVAGDSLTSIARRYGLAVTVLASYNNLSSDSKLSIGQQIIVPIYSDIELDDVYEEYTVQNGDTLYLISALFGVDIDKIVSINNISDYDSIYAGQKIKIPVDRSEKVTSETITLS